MCSNNEIIAVIWEDKAETDSLRSNFRHLVSDLVLTFQMAGVSGVLVKRRGEIAVLPESLDCDLYEMLKGNASAFNNYRGEFMAQYSWAELTNAYLEKLTLRD